MKTIRFDATFDEKNPLYRCSISVDQSGEYVPASVAQRMSRALEKIASGMGGDLLGTTSLTRDDMQEIARKGLQP